VASPLPQFLINPDSSATALWQFLPAESSSNEAGKKWAKKCGHRNLPTKHISSCA
jgi:hypothetical protein